MAINAGVLVSGTLPELQTAERTLSRRAGVAGITYNIADYGGFRTAADTADILRFRDTDYAAYLKTLKPGQVPVAKTRFRAIAPFGESMHDFGAAFDVALVSYPKNMTRAQALDALGALADAAGLRWGKAFGDPVHFELPLTLAQARALYARDHGDSAVQAILADAAAGKGAATAARVGLASSGVLVSLAVGGVILLLVLVGQRKLGA